MHATVVHAERKLVLEQLDRSLPAREQYLPQLMSGPGSLTWSPDSREVIYSMAGSLWRQRVDSNVAIQLTDGPGYDYQPDWSPDGRAVVYTSYRHDALELWLLDLASGESRQLTSGGHVNLEPRFSPDGQRLVWVSTAYRNHFHLFLGEMRNSSLVEVKQLTEEHISTLERQYSAHDIEISPVWTRDGRSLVFVSNRNHVYGTGGFWQIEAQPGSTPRELHYEETNWRARPDLSPDGTRLVYSSYVGRNWLQLWLLPASGGDALPISYGEWDEASARWSPDGQTIAFISNRGGNTSLWLQNVTGGAQRELRVSQRQRLRPGGQLELALRDEHGAPMPARVSVTDAQGRFYAPARALVHAEDGYDRRDRPFESHYFHSPGEESVDVPVGELTVEIVRGPRYPFERRKVRVMAGGTVRLESRAGKRIDEGLPDADRWVSGDVHVHMNFGGNYRIVPEGLLEQAAAEHLPIVHALITNREQRIPDIAYSGRKLDPASNARQLLQFGQEYHTNFWGHLGVLADQGPVLIPGYSAYVNTAAASLSPTNGDIADLARGRGALIGYIHPFFEEPDPANNEHLTKEMPVDVALGKVDYVEVLGYSDHRATAAVWYRFLNLGFRLPAAAGTDAMTNYATMHGPVGLNRVYVPLAPGPLTMEDWLAGLRAGHTFASNGPLLRFTLDDKAPGEEVTVEHGPVTVRYRGSLRSFVPVDHLEVVCNGTVARRIALEGNATKQDFSGTFEIDKSGWCLLRASSDGARYPILDNYAYATTSPVYVNVAGQRPVSAVDAAYFCAWIDRTAAVVERYTHWNSSAEKASVMAQLNAARAVYVERGKP